jgi:hypothetical protein
MSAALFASLAAGIIVLFAGLAAVAAAADTSAGGTVAEPAGYRMSDYRAPVPATLAGARVIDTEAAYALWNGETAGKAVFIDVLPQPQRPPELPRHMVRFTFRPLVGAWAQLTGRPKRYRGASLDVHTAFSAPVTSLGSAGPILPPEQPLKVTHER